MAMSPYSEPLPLPATSITTDPHREQLIADPPLFNADARSKARACRLWTCDLS